MAEAVEAEASNTSGKVAMAIEAFARALRQIPTYIADNAGLDRYFFKYIYIYIKNYFTLATKSYFLSRMFINCFKKLRFLAPSSLPS